jgi:hypothetical protein
VGEYNVQVVADMLQQDVAEAGRAIAGRVREHGGDASVHAAAASRDGRSLEDRAHAALSTCPRFVLLDFKCATAVGSRNCRTGSPGLGDVTIPLTM